MKKLFQIFGWAAYLACSWTWCIGMFLPIILMRDYGPLSWLMFAIPNVIGATGMGYILKNQKASIDIVNNNKAACVTFSVITILFQIYFLGWISIFIPKNLIIFILAGLILLCFLTKSSENLSAVFTWMLSLICILLALRFLPLESIKPFEFNDLSQNKNALLYLAPVCAFGFLICPYLDLTFHKVRQSNDHSNSKTIFTFGFAILFLIMIIFTFLYAKPFNSIVSEEAYLLKDQINLPTLYIFTVLFHMFMQAGFTSMVHINSLIKSIQKRNVIFPILFILAIVIYILPETLNGIRSILGIDLNEIIYRVFMSFYALVAPTYVYYFILPKGKNNTPVNKHNLTIWITVILLALPFYALGFLGIKWHLEYLALIGLTIVLVARSFIRNKA